MSIAIKHMDIDQLPKTPSTFANVVEQFLQECCILEEQQSIEDAQLFANFRAYYKRVWQGEPHPALLGQFRVELTQRGYHSSSDKHPTWYGLTLRLKEA
ncbi:hypothetical protein KSD_89730 [Ktedonobacter sp. SOSP1-85]|uniref:hypothetical protein n=1 Tax=Ktedonobacter sp. SOSP1-85 TaxID=2778367 RepID=UPI0019152811|nr:hypothetical protein [Ktedonobacter sp. SOSP1-85]GHO81202.1 hypothetical protein KSD_89730 [Ktedonobacter sp. SOSP1-85]